ncbi:MAG: L-seryl-tRNA(Sec) selenium transferase, partial [Planctomycetota bacterium]
LTLAALEATLKLFLDESLALSEVPTLRMLRRDTSEITKHANRLASRIGKAVSGIVASTVPGFSQMGSGSLPAQDLPTTLVALCPDESSPESLAAQLRRYRTPVFTRIQNDQVLIDPRTLLSGDDKIILEALIEILGRSN